MHDIFGERERAKMVQNSHDDTLVACLSSAILLFGERLAPALPTSRFLSSAVSWIGVNWLSSDRRGIPLSGSVFSRFGIQALSAVSKDYTQRTEQARWCNIKKWGATAPPSYPPLIEAYSGEPAAAERE